MAVIEINRFQLAAAGGSHANEALSNQRVATEYAAPQSGYLGTRFTTLDEANGWMRA